MKPTVTLRHALDNPDLFGRVLEGDSWATWRVVMLATMAEPLTDTEREIHGASAGRTRKIGSRLRAANPARRDVLFLI